jgi:hypothetical protein
VPELIYSRFQVTAFDPEKMQSCQCLANFRFQNSSQYRADWQDYIFLRRLLRRIKSATITWAKASIGTPRALAASRSSLFPAQADLA